jgi:hypothetical protein
MEEVLDLYEEPYDEKRPVVCFDERPCQLLAEVREPLRLGAGRPERRDHEYERRGMAHLFVAFEPLRGWRGVEVRERRRGREFAEFVSHLAQDLYPDAKKIRLVVDNLNIHTPASFYELFDPERARELSRRIEFCYTPVHGSWLNMAEIEISVLVRQCLGVGAYRRRRPWEGRREPGARSETGKGRAWIGASERRMPERSCADSIHPLSVDRELEGV